MITTVLSDLDGVLVASMDATRRAWTAWGDRHGIDGAALQSAHHGWPARDVVALVVDAADVPAETEFVRRTEVADVVGIRAFEGAAGILRLPRVAVVTSCEAALAVARLHGAGLTAPRVVVTADMVTHGKPAPDAYLLAARRLGAAPADCVVIEDAPAGVAAGRAAGMTVWAVSTTHHPRELGDAHRVASGLPELLADLESAPA